MKDSFNYNKERQKEYSIKDAMLQLFALQEEVNGNFTSSEKLWWISLLWFLTMFWLFSIVFSWLKISFSKNVGGTAAASVSAGLRT